MSEHEFLEADDDCLSALPSGDCSVASEDCPDPARQLADRASKAEAQVAQLAALLKQQQAQVEALTAELTAIRGSRSWRTIQRLQPTWRRVRPLVSLLWRWGRFGLQTLRYGPQAGLRWLPRRKAEMPPKPAYAPKAIPAKVDVIICIHNALADVQRCLSSVIRCTRVPHRLILVDDGSDRPTQEYLDQFARLQDATLIRNDEALGYTKAANQGLRYCCAEYRVLLNSDTVVVPDWLDRMLACAESDPRIGLVGPLSNTASWQSVPELLNEHGDWASNDLPEGMSEAEMGALVARCSARAYPRLPFLNGFCLLIKKKVIEQIGYFDEVAFPKGYGEENDYCVRARRRGRELAVADDVYVYHSQSRSYSHQHRMQLCAQANDVLIARYGRQLVAEGVEQCRNDRVMQGIRARGRVAANRDQLLRDGLRRWEGRRVALLLPTQTASDGGRIAIQEGRAMQAMGVDVRIVGLRSGRTDFQRAYPDSPIPAVYLEEPRLCGDFLLGCDAIVALGYSALDWLQGFRSSGKAPLKVFYVQDGDPVLCSGSADRGEVSLASLARDSALAWITKTERNRKIVQESVGVDCAVVGPSVDIDLFRPRRRPRRQPPNGVLRVAVKLHPGPGGLGPGSAVKMLEELRRQSAGSVEVVLFGGGVEDPCLGELPEGFDWRRPGLLTRPQLCCLLSDVDVFLDLAGSPAMSLMAWEAMACGAAAIVPQEGGDAGYLQHGTNALLADTGSPQQCMAALEALLHDADLRKRLQQRAIRDVCLLSPEVAAYRLLECLFPAAGRIRCP